LGFSQQLPDVALIFFERRTFTGLKFWVAIHTVSAAETHHPGILWITEIAVFHVQVNRSTDSPPMLAAIKSFIYDFVHRVFLPEDQSPILGVACA
jgi:hypothetical protein